MPQLRQPLPDGPLDLIGDVHGELAALETLLGHLGVDTVACTASRPLVFVGDLIDRGPDSVGVVRLVRRLAEAGVAWCIAGNHEINLLRGLKREGNGWARGDAEDRYSIADPYGHVTEGPFDSRLATAAEREETLAFLRTLPLVLERDDLRVVHACWWPRSLAALPAEGDVARLSTRWRDDIDAELRATGLLDRSYAELQRYRGLRARRLRPSTYPEAHVAVELARRRDNPIKAMTSGVEEPIGPDATPRFLSGKYRYLRRVAWWQDYTDPQAVVVGHYWRQRSAPIPGKPAPWQTPRYTDWAGPKGNVFCVDFSVGRRYAERVFGKAPPFRGALAALRWPERTLVFDDQPEPVATTGWGEPRDPTELA